MRGLLIIILAIPALAALGHDIYLFVTNGGSVDAIQQSLQTTLDGEKSEPGVKTFFASLGYIWTHYEPESYKWTVENTDKKTWALISLLLTQKAVLVGAVFAGFFYFILFTLRLLGVGAAEKSITGSSSGGRMDKILNPGKKSKKMKYKRK